MDRMVIIAVFVWIVVLSLFRFGPALSPPDSGAADGERPAAFFPHDDHMEVLDCMSCHHRFEDGKNVATEDELDGSDEMRCRHCHDENASVNSREAFHRQCIGCHRAFDKEGKTAGPETCGECHPTVVPEDSFGLVIER
jgi:hypothetical protein